MKVLVLLTTAALTLSACGSTPGNSTGFFDNGKDVSFLRQGTGTCPGVIESGNPIYERYPLRCGPQSQIVQR